MGTSNAYKNHRKYYLKKAYGITPEEYNELLAQQDGVCAICGNTCPTGYTLSVDHNHETGRVRGLLCMRCNAGIGNLKNIDNLLRAVLYLREDENNATE